MKREHPVYITEIARILLLGALSFCLITGQISAQPYVTKRGGVLFRFDNNPVLSKLHQVDSVFISNNQRFSLAITSWILPLFPEYIDTLIQYSGKGHEIMDNTPTHQTQYFTLINPADTTLFTGHPGVDHFNNTKVCLSYAAVDTFQNHGEGLVNVTGNMVISQNPGEFGDLAGTPYFFALYLNTVNGIFLWYNRQAFNPADPDTVFIQSFWEESVNLGTKPNLRYHKLTRVNVIMKTEALQLLGQRTLDLFQEYNIPRPTAWIHPEGQMPYLTGYQVKSIYGDMLDYGSGSNFVNRAFLCYNEFNPYRISQFGMQGDPVNLSANSFKHTKQVLANAIAKHYVKMDIASLQNPAGGWDSYLSRLDSLLNWCTLHQIPVGTYSQWKNWLYDSIPLRVADIFPALGVDLDDSGYPDGFDTLDWIDGEYDTLIGVQASDSCSFRLAGQGTFCQITQLAGLEFGNNTFSVWTKTSGQDTAEIHILFSFPENGMISGIDVIADTSEWTQRSGFLDIPDSVTVMNVLITRTDTLSDTVWISGMELKSSGFLIRSVYPEQSVLQNEQFGLINVHNLVIDSLYAPSSISWWVTGQSLMDFRFPSSQYLQPLKPQSFWTGSDEAWLQAMSPDGKRDSCRLNFTSLPMTMSCPGIPVTISLLDTLENDYITWTSVPEDTTISDPHVYNPTVNPEVTTLYKVKAISPLGPINYDSILIERFPVPFSGLPVDTTICEGDSVLLVAQGGISYLWNTGDTSSSIMVSPPFTADYWVTLTSSDGCQATDTTTVIVIPTANVQIYSLWPTYCVYDIPSSASGQPPGGVFAGTGMVGDVFYPEIANLGPNIITYSYTDQYGCFGADTVIVNVYPRPVINPLPEDTTVCAEASIHLDAGSGGTSYLWRNGASTPAINLDTTGIGLGLYEMWVYVTKDGCVNMDTAYVEFVKCPIGLDERIANDHFAIYPNPAESYVVIEPLDQIPSLFHAEILDTRGIIQVEVEETNSIANVSVGHLSPGFYLVKVTSQDYSYIFRLIIR